MSIDGFTEIKLPGLLKFKRSLGPDVTIRPLAMESVTSFKDFSNWTPSLGDLEVFKSTSVALCHAIRCIHHIVRL